MADLVKLPAPVGLQTRRERLIYAAGLFDGEGCCGVYADSHKHCIVRMSIGMTSPHALALFAELFGGRVTPMRHVRNKRRVDGTPYAPVWLWCITSAHAGRALSELLPFLHEKRAQAELCLEARALQRRRPRGCGAAWLPEDVRRVTEIRAQVKALKRPG